ncbi:MAG: dihydrodipicolinate synthase family protein [Syntrophus sp. (in: bacteria)]|nr:dihydrodipicolinate synthase family protein [Syntrophus sp. (in: bacteria)]
MAKLHGIITALPTPLLANEDVDVQSLKQLIDYVIKEGANGIFVLGNMGEGPALLDSQKLIVVKAAIEHAKKRVPVLTGIAEVSPRRMIELGKKVKDLNPDYLVITTPFYYRFPHPDSLVGSVEKICGELNYPTVFYHCPGATGNKVNTASVLKIMEVPQIKAIKDSSGDIYLVAELLRKYPDKNSRPCAILQGDENVYDISLLMGADGVITGGGTAFVDTLAKLYKAAVVEKDQLKAFALQQQFRKDMDEMLGSDLLTDWMYAIKNNLKEKGVMDNNVTFPFMKRKK